MSRRTQALIVSAFVLAVAACSERALVTTVRRGEDGEVLWCMSERYSGSSRANVAQARRSVEACVAACREFGYVADGPMIEVNVTTSFMQPGLEDAKIPARCQDMTP